MTMQQPRKHHRWITSLAAAAALASLAACDKPGDERTAGQKLDAAVVQTDQKATELKNDASRATDTATDKVKDAAITAAVNAELAKAPNLSVMKIDVDTANGRVALHGSAPDEQARERATQVASSVSGVVSVDNALTIAPKQ